MRQSCHGRFRRQVEFLRRQFLQGGGPPFTDVLPAGRVARALAAVGAAWYDRIYSPLVTLWVFLGQALSAGHSCRAAVTRLNAPRVSRGQRPGSARAGAYGQARRRLPGRVRSDVARRTGRALEGRADPRWLWKGQRAYAYDGPEASTPDTPANQRDYPQPDTQKPGPGFSLAGGAVVEPGLCRYAGRGQSELGLLRTLPGVFRPGDFVPADRLTCAWTEMVLLKRRGVDSVARLGKRPADFRRGKRLGPGDHVVAWARPRKPR
jgi:hypothetical protein